MMPIILLFIVAFAVAFLALMKNDEGFNGFPISILTTFVMVIGEIDYRDVFLQDRNSSNQFFQRLFLVLIVVLCGIVLMNFLIGLAVDDTSKIIERSEAEKRMEKVCALLNIM
jgi:transient receptor potential cation channel subfamily A protein 1